MLEIRSLAPEDSLDALTALLHRAYAALGAMGLNYTAVNQSPAVTASRIAQGDCFVAMWGGALAGTILIKPTHTQSESVYFTKPGVASAHQFAVEPSCQGRGIGRALLHHAEQWAAAQGFQWLALDTAAPATHLIDLYQRLGYERVEVVQWPGKVYQSAVLIKALPAHDSGIHNAAQEQTSR